MSVFSSALRRGRPSRVRDFHSNRAATPSGASAEPSPAALPGGAVASLEARDGEARPIGVDPAPGGGDVNWCAARPGADGGGPGSQARGPGAIERQRRTYEAQARVIRASGRIATPLSGRPVELDRLMPPFTAQRSRRTRRPNPEAFDSSWSSVFATRRTDPGSPSLRQVPRSRERPQGSVASRRFRPSGG